MLQKFQALPILKTQYPELFRKLGELFPYEKKTAIALSGGSDSMFLSFVITTFWKEKNRDINQIFFLHCNHQVRKESEDEADFLKKFFEGWQLVIFKREKIGPENEETLRKRRYESFQTFCTENKITQLLLGHNLTDRIETSLMHMIRGCGLQGFLNMQEKENHHLLEKISVFRPLLTLSKQAIEAGCKKYSIPFVQDQSNFDTSTSLRNKLRNDFLFPIKDLGKATKDGKSVFFQSWNNIYENIEKQEKSDPSKRLLPLKISPYRNADSAFKRAIPKGAINDGLIIELFTLLNIPHKKNEIKEFGSRLTQGENGTKTVGKRTFFLAHEQIILIKGKTNFRGKELHLEKKITKAGLQTFGKFQLDIAENLIGTTLRFPRKGDHFEGKLLGKRAINKKIPIFWRNALPLAEKDKKIIVVFTPQEIIF